MHRNIFTLGKHDLLDFNKVRRAPEPCSSYLLVLPPCIFLTPLSTGIAHHSPIGDQDTKYQAISKLIHNELHKGTLDTGG